MHFLYVVFHSIMDDLIRGIGIILVGLEKKVIWTVFFGKGKGRGKKGSLRSNKDL